MVIASPLANKGAILSIMQPISRREFWHALGALILVIFLQLTISSKLRVGSNHLIAGLEIILVLAIGFTAPRRHHSTPRINRSISYVLIALISIANAGALFLLTRALLKGADIPGQELLRGALAIFLTNVIVFGLWFWELDSPGLSGRRQRGRAKHFQFPQDVNRDSAWRPTFFDYLYTALTNGTAFSPTDTLPLTHAAKSLMSVQSLISLITVVLVTARAVNILA